MNSPECHYNVIQQTPEWEMLKLGKFSGSDYHIYLGTSKTKEDNLYDIAAQRITGDSDNESVFKSKAMERGNILEPEARRVFSAIIEHNIREVGFVDCAGEFYGWAGCSPDGLIGDNGIIEIKCPLMKGFLKYKRTKKIDPQYKTQIQFNLMVTERQYCYFIVYHPRFPIEYVKIERDEDVINKIRESLKENIEKVKKICQD